jgi:hypothetical protein
MIVLDHQPRWWFLLQDGDALLFDVHCSHGPVDYAWTMFLNAAETSQLRAAGRAFLGALAGQVQSSAPGARGSNSPFLDRNVDSAVRERVLAAVLQWRKAQVG